jgi:DNA-binding transcriptional MerR regulator
MRIGEIARRAGIRASAVRYYERLGLLPAPPRVNGRRLYAEAIVDRLMVIRAGRDCGFTLREIGALLGAGRYAEGLRGLARRKSNELEEMIARARAMQSLLGKAARCRCRTAEQCGRALTLPAPQARPATSSRHGASRRSR